VLLQKSKALKVPDLKVRWLGFDLPEVYVIGYGLDAAEKYRNLPYLAEFDPETNK
jgi:hypoxanthine phosphoribosyltransferase